MPTNNDDGKSVFAQFIDDPEQRAPETVPQIDPRSLPLGRLLYWLTHHWSNPTISLRQIRIYGHRDFRDPKIALDTAEALAKRGFLLAIPACRIDQKLWKVIRENEQVGAPAPTRQTEQPPNRQNATA